ncbi:carbohydrate kinase family protein [Gayadomonas joobiniege]|uniref:carbohydrate kinase family protein n=1 Tax=Gayadomonas joobiniege TaxID=1234606 RepID=UPI00035CEFC2|nr:carbohydrate kinase [Gayadomonas joobiniege]
MNVVCIGELLIDFVCTDQQTPMKDSVHFLKKTGGAPANVAACIAKLGGQSQFAGAVGKDPFGDSLIEALQTRQVDTSLVVQLPTPTTLAFISLAADGEREFVFNRGADGQYQLSDKQVKNIMQGCSILHLGSATALLGDELYQTYQQALRAAIECDVPVCFDPNYRIDLWPDREQEFVERSLQFIRHAKLVKVSDEELTLLTGKQDLADGCQYLHDLGAKIITVTLGPKGCYLSTQQQQAMIPAYKIKPIDTTGAGDSFIGALLYQLAKQPDCDFDTIADYVLFANKVSGIVCEHLGPMTGLSDYQSIAKTKKELNKN